MKILSGYVTNKDGVCNAQELINDEIIERDDRKCTEDEADSRIFLYITSAAKKDFKQFLVLSNHNNVLMYKFTLFSYFQINKCQLNLGKT